MSRFYKSSKEGTYGIYWEAKPVLIRAIPLVHYLLPYMIGKAVYAKLVLKRVEEGAQCESVMLNTSTCDSQTQAKTTKLDVKALNEKGKWIQTIDLIYPTHPCVLICGLIMVIRRSDGILYETGEMRLADGLKVELPTDVVWRCLMFVVASATMLVALATLLIVIFK